MFEELEDTTEVESDQISLNEVRDTYRLQTSKMKDNWKMSYAWFVTTLATHLRW